MRPRPPAMRPKWRYILARILPNNVELDQKQVYLSVLDAATSLWGDAATGLMQPAVIHCDRGYVIIRCRRGSERDLATALATVTSAADRPIAIRTIATSGTIRTLRRQMRPELPDEEAEELRVGKKYFTAYRYSRQKVDLIEKHNKHPKVLFFTETDMEEI